MAKYECTLHGDFNETLNFLHNELLNSSTSVTYEDGSTKTMNNVTCAVRIYERYSWIGSNRVSLNITLLETENEIFLTAITSGGSQAVFFKINTVGEESFLDCLKNIIERIQ